MTECTYWEYPGGGEPPRPCPKAAQPGSVYCPEHRAAVLEGITRRLAAMTQREEAA